MDFDFILTSVIYLATILFIHITLKNNDVIDIPIKVLAESTEVGPHIVSEETGSPDKSTDISSIMTEEDGLIINATELNNMNHGMSNNDFIKYLDVEGTDSESVQHQLASPLQKNTIDITSSDTKTDLDKYFTNIKDEQYSFNPVPTSKTTPSESSGLFSSTKPLNINADDKHIMPFDDFGELYAPI